jgi:DNA-binding winged helix-turn-helix (wHTH) protein
MVASSSVDVLHWPADRERRDSDTAQRGACLWLVGTDDAPPQDLGELEDWARTSADPIEIHTRISALADRASRVVNLVPVLDGNGVLRRNGAWVALGALEARLVGRLLEDFGHPVEHRVLVEACWDTIPTSRVLEPLVVRLRRHVRPLALAVHNVRGHGYALVDVGSAPQTHHYDEHHH